MAVVFIQASDPAFISEGSGDDRYIVSALVAPNQVVTITDGEGVNTLQLEPGIEITSSATNSNFMTLNLSNGATINITNANNFTFVTGPTQTVDPLTGTSETFSAFVTNSLGLAEVPTGDTLVDGGTVTVVSGGGTDVTDIAPTETFSLSGDGFVDEGQVATFTLTTTNVPAGTDVDYTITGISASDVVGGLTGTATVGAGGTASIAVPIVADQLTEGPENLTLSLDNGQTSASTVVLDTSFASANSYLSGVGGNGVVSDFNIEVVFESTFSAAERAALETAADYISLLITGDLPNDGAIDDIRISATLEFIDGVGKILGSARSTDLRSDGTYLPSQGEMFFDSADAASELSQGTFVDLVVHEMIHALGFGSIWDLQSLVDYSAFDLRFSGVNATVAYNSEFSFIAQLDPNSFFGVPVETEYGPGTAGVHWDEETFFDEIMTGFLSPFAYMSAMSVAALEDMGYDTVFNFSTPAATMPQLDDFNTDGGTTISRGIYFLLDQDAELAGNPNRLNNTDVDGIVFGLSDANGYAQITLNTAAANDAGTHAGFVNALQPTLQALIDIGILPAGTTLTLDPNFVDRTFLDDGTLSDNIPAIVISASNGATITPLGFSRVDEFIGEFNLYSRFESITETFDFVAAETFEHGGAEGLGDLPMMVHVASGISENTLLDIDTPVVGVAVAQAHDASFYL